MSDLVLIGASGFIGRHLLERLPKQRVRVLAHRNRPASGNDVTSIEGDLLRVESLASLLTPGCTVINLAYLARAGGDENLAAATNLAAAAAAARAKRLIHLSSATVVGRCADDVVTESTPPRPSTEYERSKLAVEELLLAKAKGAFELVILRPAAVFGPWGINLLQLAEAVYGGSLVANYVRSAFHGRRRMNLVCVENVVAAIQFLAEVHLGSARELFIISDDEEPNNNYRDVERMLFDLMNRRYYPTAPLSLPPPMLTAVLQLRGRSNVNPRRVYSAQKLRSMGFRRPTNLATGLASFAKWFLDSRAQADLAA